MTLSAEQQAIRRHAIGGSEIAAVAGLDPYRGPLQVYLQKKGLLDREETAHMERGTHLGPALVRWYEARTGRVVSHAGDHEATVRHPAHPIVVATPDGRIHATTRASKVVAALECKAPHWRTAAQWGEPGTDDIPDHYVPQVTWEMAALDVNHADIAALLGGDLAIYTMRFDAELFAALLDCAQAFVRDHLDVDNPPPPDGSEAARHWLLQRYPRATADIIDATEAQAEMLRQRAALKAQSDVIDDQLELLDQQLFAAIGEHQGLRCEAGIYKMIERKGSPAWKRIAEDLGATADMIAKHTGQGTRYPRWTAAK